MNALVSFEELEEMMCEIGRIAESIANGTLAKNIQQIKENEKNKGIGK
ncbi:MAG: hypothetical protein KAH77_05295 [Thiomargarita sp.]|nr:hypothetical protein [Thiomargarita sp.]